ncbi:MAG: hypothetical protein ACI9DC_003043 [Gammaproteobacteria bacterium]
MALPKRGSRKITVDGTDYRWAIRRKPSDGQAIEDSNLTASVELFDNHWRDSRFDLPIGASGLLDHSGWNDGYPIGYDTLHQNIDGEGLGCRSAGRNSQSGSCIRGPCLGLLLARFSLKNTGKSIFRDGQSGGLRLRDPERIDRMLSVGLFCTIFPGRLRTHSSGCVKKADTIRVAA